MGDNESEKETRARKRGQMTVRNGSGEWHGNVQDGAGTASYAVVTWYRHGKADQ
jgi:hypothetical protein